MKPTIHEAARRLEERGLLTRTRADQSAGNSRVAASSTLVIRLPNGAVPKPSWLTARPVRPNGRVAAGS